MSTTLLSRWTRRRAHAQTAVPAAAPIVADNRSDIPPAWYLNVTERYCEQVTPTTPVERLEAELATLRERNAPDNDILAVQIELAIAFMDTHFERLNLKGALSRTKRDEPTGGDYPELVVVHTGNLDDSSRECYVQTPQMTVGKMHIRDIKLTVNPPEMNLADLSRMLTDRTKNKATGTGFQATWTVVVEGTIPAKHSAVFFRLGLGGGATETEESASGITAVNPGGEVLGALEEAGATGLLVAPAEGWEVRMGDPMGAVAIKRGNELLVWRVTGFFILDPVA